MELWQDVSRVEELLRTARDLLAEAEKSASEQRLIMKVGSESESELASSLRYETTVRNVVDEFADGSIVGFTTASSTRKPRARC